MAAKLMERLGIAEQLKNKTKLVDSVPVAEIVAKGEAEIGLQQINVILPVAGADYVGPLPAHLQGYVDFVFRSVSEKNWRFRSLAMIQRVARRTATSTFALSRGFLGRAGTMAVS